MDNGQLTFEKEHIISKYVVWKGSHSWHLIQPPAMKHGDGTKNTPSYPRYRSRHACLSPGNMETCMTVVYQRQIVVINIKFMFRLLFSQFVFGFFLSVLLTTFLRSSGAQRSWKFTE